MQCRIGQASIHYVARGAGRPLLALHGAGVDHREIESAIEPAIPAAGYRRIYPDLPAMGRSTARGIDSIDDVVAALLTLLERVARAPVLLLGHSYGAYLAAAMAAARPDAVRGLALLCPLAGAGDVPEPSVVRDDTDARGELAPADRAGFEDYFVVRTRHTAARYRDHVLPGTRLVDEDAAGRVFSRWAVADTPRPYPGPVAIVAGRSDATAGYRGAVALSDEYPRATLAVLDDAGHALMHERQDLVAALLRDWLDRV